MEAGSQVRRQLGEGVPLSLEPSGLAVSSCS